MTSGAPTTIRAGTHERRRRDTIQRATIILACLAAAVVVVISSTAADSHAHQIETATVSGDLQDAELPSVTNLSVVCTGPVLVYGLDLLVPANDPDDLYGLLASTIRLGSHHLDHRPYGSGPGHMHVRLLDTINLPYPLMIPGYTPLVVPVYALDVVPGRPATATLEVAYVAGFGVECSGSALAGPQRVGFIAPSIDDSAEAAAANLSVDDYNDHLASLGERWRLELATKEASTPEESLQAVKELASEGVRLVVVGPVGEASLVVIGEHAERWGMVVVSCCSASPELAIPGDHILRMTPSGITQASTLAEVLAGDGVQVVVVAHRDDAYGRGVTEALAIEMERRGGAVGETVPYPAAATGHDFERIAGAVSDSVRGMVAANGADRVAVVAVSSDEVAWLAGSAASHPVLDDVRWYVSDRAVGTTELTRGDPGAFAERVGLAGLSVAAPPSLLAGDLSARIADRLGLPPDALLGVSVHSTYDSILILGNAILATQNSQPAILLEVIPQVAARTYGAMHHDKLDANGDLASSDYDLWVVADGSWSRVGTLVGAPAAPSSPSE